MKNPFIPTILIVVTAIFFLAFNQVTAQTTKGKSFQDTVYRVPDPLPLLIDTVPPKEDPTPVSSNPTLALFERVSETLNISLVDSSDTKWTRKVGKFKGVQLQLFKIFENRDKPVIINIGNWEYRESSSGPTKVIIVNNDFIFSFSALNGFRKLKLVFADTELQVYTPNTVKNLKLIETQIK